MPDHREIGIPGGRLLEGHEALAVAAQFHQGGALQGQRERGLAELVGGLRGEGQCLFEAALSTEQLEILAPREGEVGLVIDELEVCLLRLIERGIAEEVPRPGQGTLTGLGGKHAEL